MTPRMVTQPSFIKLEQIELKRATSRRKQRIYLYQSVHDIQKKFDRINAHPVNRLELTNSDRRLEWEAKAGNTVRDSYCDGIEFQPVD